MLKHIGIFNILYFQRFAEKKIPNSQTVTVLVLSMRNPQAYRQLLEQII